jgi:hypothetical protein
VQNRATRLDISLAGRPIMLGLATRSLDTIRLQDQAVAKADPCPADARVGQVPRRSLSRHVRHNRSVSNRVGARSPGHRCQMVAPWIRHQRTAQEKSFSISIAFARSSLAILSKRFFFLGSAAAFAARLTRAPSARSSSAGESISLAIAGKRARPQLVPSEGRGPASWSRRPKAATRAIS